jgi:glucokinase
MAILKTNEWYHPRSRKQDKAAVTPELLTEALANGVREICEEAGVPLSEVGHVGIGISGPVAPDGTVISAPNLEAFDQVSLGVMVKEALGHTSPGSVANDIDVAALGEKVLGAAQGVPTAALFYVGTGVGAGLVVDGQLLRSAGEVGHAPAVFGFRRHQTQPAAGSIAPTVEAFAGGNSLAARFNAELDAGCDIDAGQPSSLRKQLQEGGRLTAMDLDEAARNGDTYARDFLREAADILANAMLYLSVTARLNRIVLGGGVLERCPLLRAMAMESYGARAHPLASNVQFTTPEHGEWAGALGAAQLAPA